MELDENEEDTEDNSSEGWEMEDDDEAEEEEEDESDDSFEDGDIDVSQGWQSARKTRSPDPRPTRYYAS